MVHARQTAPSTTQPDTTASPPDTSARLRLPSLPDSAAVDSLAPPATPSIEDSASIPRYRADSLAAPDLPDTSRVDSAASARADSLQKAHEDSLAAVRARLEALREAALRDTMAPPAPSPTALTLDRRDWSWHPYKGTGDVFTRFGGLWPRQFDLFAQPYYAVPPGATGRELAVVYRGRPYGEPATDAVNTWTMAVEEINRMHLESAWAGAGPMGSGPVLHLETPYYYGIPAVTRIVYRQGWYGLGHADWRIAQQVSEEFSYHFGVDIGEFQGRYAGTAANTSQVRLGGRQRILGLGHLQLYWMQTRLDPGRPYQGGVLGTHRNDLDLVLSSGDERSDRFRELAFWYVRNQRNYAAGSNDGNRLGARLLFQRQLNRVHRLTLRGDVERTAARFFRRPEHADSKGRRWIAGATAADRLRMPKLDASAALRIEWGRHHGLPDTAEAVSALRLGGSLNADWGDTLGPGLLLQASSGWRWPSLDESHGYWSGIRPDRWMDPRPAPADSAFYHGNRSLEPVDMLFGGIGARYRWERPLQIRILGGVRNWSGLVEVEREAGTTWTRSQGRDVTALELTGYGSVPVWGPVRAAGSWTFSDGLREDDPIPSTWGWASLRFDRTFYNGQLHLRIAATGRYFGSYQTPEWEMPARWMLDGLIRAKIYSFEAYWGSPNILSGAYHYIPGYPAMHREEIWGVRWILWE